MILRVSNGRTLLTYRSRGGDFVQFSKTICRLFSSSTNGSSAVKSQRPSPSTATELQMFSFYHFEPLPIPGSSRDILFKSLRDIPGLRGTVYLASEGVNAQMAVPPESLKPVLDIMSTKLPWDPFRALPPNMGEVVSVDTPTFNRLLIRTRDFILRDGIPEDIELDWSDAGPELSASDWQKEMILQSSPTILDCRNTYETSKGTFQGAIPLQTNKFRESWEQIDELTEKLPRDEPLMIFCTGGVRCVKVGAYLKQHLGFSNVKRLKHGIIGYQQWLDQEDRETRSVWEGDNFLFDKRSYDNTKDGES